MEIRALYAFDQIPKLCGSTVLVTVPQVSSLDYWQHYNTVQGFIWPKNCFVKGRKGAYSQTYWTAKWVGVRS